VIHILASVAFSMIAFGSLALIAFMLLRDQDKIMAALGFQPVMAPRVARRPVRVRAATRWQAASATTARPRRAAA
jgi:hypothetical protein